MTALVSAVWGLWVVLIDRWPALERRLLVPLALVGLVGLTAIGVPKFARTGPPGKQWSDNVGRLAPALARLPRANGPVILRCDGDEGCIYLAGLVLWFDRHGTDARMESPFGVVTAGAPRRVYTGGPIRAVLHVRVGVLFYANATRPNSKLVAYVGARPTAKRARIRQPDPHHRGRLRTRPARAGCLLLRTIRSDQATRHGRRRHTRAVQVVSCRGLTRVGPTQTYADAKRPDATTGSDMDEALKERKATGRLLRKVVPRSAHADLGSPAGVRDPLGVLETQATSRVPELVPIRHGRMAESAVRVLPRRRRDHGDGPRDDRRPPD